MAHFRNYGFKSCKEMKSKSPLRSLQGTYKSDAYAQQYTFNKTCKCFSFRLNQGIKHLKFKKLLTVLFSLLYEIYA